MSSCTCATCQAACRHEPGAYEPSQVDTSMDVVLRWRPIDGVRVHYPTPRWIGPGIHGTCVHLQAGRCAIYDKRPRECREYSHGDSKRTVARRLDRIVAKWAAPSHRPLLVAIAKR